MACHFRDSKSGAKIPNWVSMKYILIIALVALVAMVVVSLVRGIVAFLQSTKMDLEGGDERVKEMQRRQNKAMMSRIKYQAAAILVAMVLLAAVS